MPVTLFAQVLCAIGSGLLITLRTDTSTSLWATYMVLTSLGLDIGVNAPHIAIQAVMKNFAHHSCVKIFKLIYVSLATTMFSSLAVRISSYREIKRTHMLTRCRHCEFLGAIGRVSKFLSEVGQGFFFLFFSFLFMSVCNHDRSCQTGFRIELIEFFLFSALGVPIGNALLISSLKHEVPKATSTISQDAVIRAGALNLRSLTTLAEVLQGLRRAYAISISHVNIFLVVVIRISVPTACGMEWLNIKKISALREEEKKKKAAGENFSAEQYELHFPGKWAKVFGEIAAISSY